MKTKVTNAYLEESSFTIRVSSCRLGKLLASKNPDDMLNVAAAYKLHLYNMSDETKKQHIGALEEMLLALKK